MPRPDPHDLVQRVREVLDHPIMAPDTPGSSRLEVPAADVHVRVIRGSLRVKLGIARRREWSARHCDLVLGICRAIFGRQREFLVHGAEHLKPMTQSDIAGDTGLHFSTVGRCVKDLIAMTPQGEVRTRDLFSARIGTYSGGATSNRAVQELVKQIVAVERPDSPLSDAEICRTLQDRAICVKRRTVSKYRDKLGIPNRRARWRLKHPSHV